MAHGQAFPTQSTRSWREIAEQLSHEKDSVRILSLSEELMRALDLEQRLKRNSA